MAVRLYVCLLLLLLSFLSDACSFVLGLVLPTWWWRSYRTDMDWFVLEEGSPLFLLSPADVKFCISKI
jgi:hypothetical protein